ncbi:hypothetical protein Tco_1549162 [Tanacetum coccineum]
MEDQPLPADASSTALSPGYIADFDPEEDKDDPKEDLADYPTDGGGRGRGGAPSSACIIEFAAALSSSSPPPKNIKSLKDNIRG